MKIKLAFLAFLFSTHLGAQYITAEMGGAGFACPSLGYGHLVPDDSVKYSNGIMYKLGAGYASWWNLGMVRMGLYRFWGKRNNWEAGMEVGYPITDKDVVIDGVFFYPSFGFRFGKGYARGKVSLGPLVIPGQRGTLFDEAFVIPFANAGVSFRLF